jgi:hypothetical protein
LSVDAVQLNRAVETPVAATCGLPGVEGATESAPHETLTVATPPATEAVVTETPLSGSKKVAPTASGASP